MSIHSPNHEKKTNSYFTAVAPKYDYWTGSATKTLITEILTSIPLGIQSWHNYLDNGCGPGTATEAILEHFKAAGNYAPEITATDLVPAMVDALQVRIAAEGKSWETVKALVMDSRALTFKLNTFDFVFCNFSIIAFEQPGKCLTDMHRVLKPKGIAVITCWKTFGLATVIRAAQKNVKGHDFDGLIKLNGLEFFDEGYLANLVDVAGFERGKIKTLAKRIVIAGSKELEGLMEFMLGDLSKSATADWSVEEIAKWPAAIEAAVEEQKKEHGGIVMEAWVVLARKWDALCG